MGNRCHIYIFLIVYCFFFLFVVVFSLVTGRQPNLLAASALSVSLSLNNRPGNCLKWMMDYSRWTLSLLPLFSRRSHCSRAHKRTEYRRYLWMGRWIQSCTHIHTSQRFEHSELVQTFDWYCTFTVCFSTVLDLPQKSSVAPKPHRLMHFFESSFHC